MQGLVCDTRAVNPQVVIDPTSPAQPQQGLGEQWGLAAIVQVAALQLSTVRSFSVFLKRIKYASNLNIINKSCLV